MIKHSSVISAKLMKYFAWIFFMPTKTKPKEQNWYSGDFTPVLISEKDLTRFCEILNIDLHLPAQEHLREKFRQSIQRGLNQGNKRFANGIARPMPAHTLASIKTIQKHAEALSVLLHPDTISFQTQDALGLLDIDSGNSWDIIARLEVTCRVATARLEEVSGPGQHNRQFGMDLESANHQLILIFLQFYQPVSADGDADQKNVKCEFLEICRKYLPKYRPRQRTATKKKYNTNPLRS